MYERRTRMTLANAVMFNLGLSGEYDRDVITKSPQIKLLVLFHPLESCSTQFLFSERTFKNEVERAYLQPQTIPLLHMPIHNSQTP